MRYERVQSILEGEAAFRSRLGPKNHPVETRFGEQLCFSKETVEVTEALHNEGKDAHKVPKTEVLSIAIKLLRGQPSNGGNGQALSPPVAAAPPPPPPAPVVPPVAAKPAKPKAEAPPAVEPEKPPAAKPKVEPKPKAKASPPAPKPSPPVKKAAVKTAAKLSKPAAPAQPAPPPMRAKAAPAPKSPPSVAEDALPMSELPPEKQPLSLPPDFDPTKYPHYSVQSSVYSLLLSALSMAEHYERVPGMEQRQKKLDDVVKDYQDTCDAIKIKSSDGQSH